LIENLCMSQPTNNRAYPIVVCVGHVLHIAMACQTVEVDGWNVGPLSQGL
jgi:hypothetical protein